MFVLQCLFFIPVVRSFYRDLFTGYAYKMHILKAEVCCCALCSSCVGFPVWCVACMCIHKISVWTCEPKQIHWRAVFLFHLLSFCFSVLSPQLKIVMRVLLTLSSFPIVVTTSENHACIPSANLLLLLIDNCTRHCSEFPKAGRCASVIARPPPAGLRLPEEEEGGCW